MAFIAPETSKAPRKLMKAGNHIARCYSLIEIGTVENTFKGDGSTQHKIRLGWEFPTQKEVFSENKGPEPFTIGKDYNFSMNEKANLRIDLESWIGQNLTDQQANKFDIERVLGKPCLINVVHETTKKGTVISKIKTISPVPEGMSCPEQINKIQRLSFGEWDQDMFDGLPTWIRESIQQSAEYKKMNEPRFQSQPDADQQAVETLFNESEDIPF